MQVSGSWSAEVPVEKLADLVAARVLDALHAAAREATDGGDRGGWPVGRGPGAGDHHVDRDTP